MYNYVICCKGCLFKHMLWGGGGEVWSQAELGCFLLQLVHLFHIINSIQLIFSRIYLLHNRFTEGVFYQNL